MRGRVFRAEDWRQYQAVNQKFADAVCSEVDSKDPIILVQDYHFALAPAMIRKRLPAATVIVFWHIPWPNAERMGICPWRNELLEGLLGSSILGFHTQLHCNNFLDSVDRYMETRIDREHNAVVMQGHRTLIRPYPIALEWPVRWVESAASPEECRAQVWRDLELKPNALLGVGVDRLDYTKGVEERLLAVELLLERYPEFRGRFSFAQLAAPSRTKIDRYRELNETVEHLAERINQRFGQDGYQPIILLRFHHEPPEVFRYFRAADVCYVSSLHDGMNLVAKEFVAARTDLEGRAGAQRIHRSGAGADRSADRESLRSGGQQRRAGGRADDARGGAAGPHAVDAIHAGSVQRVSLGGKNAGGRRALAQSGPRGRALGRALRPRVPRSDDAVSSFPGFPPGSDAAGPGTDLVRVRFRRNAGAHCRASGPGRHARPNPEAARPPGGAVSVHRGLRAAPDRMFSANCAALNWRA